MQEKYYVINELVMFTGLTDRTIRNYLSSGILQGEKVDGMWRFTSDQVEEFVKHPAVRPSILAKKNGLVYDFLADDQKKTQEDCVILDILGKEKKKSIEYFGKSINEGGFRNIQFSYDGVKENSRVILKGAVNEVMQLVNGYYKANPIEA